MIDENKFPVTKEELFYIAGFFDGEGCVNLQMNESKKYGELTVCISNNHCGILRYIQSIFNGRIHNTRSYGYTPEWRCESKKAVFFLESVLPYLRIKRRQAELAIEFQKTVIKGMIHRKNGTFTRQIPDEILQKRQTLVNLCRQEKQMINNREV